MKAPDMNLIKYCSFLLILFILGSPACNSPEKTAGSSTAAEKDKIIKPASELVELNDPEDGMSISSGDDLTISLSLRGDKYPDSVRVFLDGAYLATLPGTELEYIASTQGRRLGKIPLKVQAYEQGKRPQTITHFITILSDIDPEVYSYRVKNMYPHDKNAYTQGLLYHEGYFYESTGGEGESTLRKVDPETGEVMKIHNLESKFFGEGLVLHNGRLFQLTWKHNVGFVYDFETFREIKRVHYTTQGWGLEAIGNELVMSDGTNNLYFLEPDYFTVLRSIRVFDNNEAVWQLNELEYINGELWANIYMTDRIARIDPETGKVLAYVDLSGILPRKYHHPELEQLNGIAWDDVNNRLFVTGKNWPLLFEIEPVER